jgi:DNA polymerase elongation subunit (family B)
MSTLRITLDVETIPTQNKKLIDAIDVKCPGNISKPESVANWEDEVKPGLIEKAYRKTSLDSTKGELIVIGWAINEEPPQCVYRDYRHDSEKDLLEAFYASILPHCTAGYYSDTQWIGHNILAFDLPYIWHRTRINKVKTTIRIPYNVSPWSDKIFDTKRTWKANSSASASLEAICTAIGIPVKTDMHGSEVWDYAQRGEIQKIANYCMNGDVVATRELFHAMR